MGRPGVAAFLCLAGCWLRLDAQPESITTLLGETVRFSDAAISPDGKRVAWVQSKGGSQGSATYVMPISGQSPPVLIKLSATGDRNDSGPAWSPDSETLAFFSTAGNGSQSQIWTVAADGSAARKRTNLKGFAARLRWSHDGTRLAFLYIEGGTGGGPLLAAPPETGVIGSEFQNQRVAVWEAASGKVTLASPANLHIYDFDWSPEDQRLAVTAAPGPGDNNWWIAGVQVIQIATQQAKEIYRPKLQAAVPKWSPDGKFIAFIEGLMSDEGFHGGDVYTIPAAGGAATNRTPARKASPSSLTWLAADRILMTEWVGGGSAISELLLANNEVRSIWSGAESVHSGGNFPNFAASRDGSRSVVVRSTFTKPPEIWAGATGDWKALTRLNAAQRPQWGEPKDLSWTQDGFRIQGWLLPPAETAGGRKSPMVVVIHGGPSGSVRPQWPADGLAVGLASKGYYILMPNPRGSFGQGEAFTQANVKDFGRGDLRDILAGVDLAVSQFPIDASKLGVTGWSYGGFMTMWTVTQTGRFKAAMAGAGIANWQSYYGQNLIDQWMIPFFGASVYDDPAVYARSSPIQFVKKVTTPTLIIVGEYDAECPAPQSYEFWHALRALGKTTELVVYKGEGHMFVDPKNRIDVQDRTLKWFERYLQ